MQGSKSGYFQNSNKRQDFDDAGWSGKPAGKMKFREKLDRNKQARRSENRKSEQKV